MIFHSGATRMRLQPRNPQIGSIVTLLIGITMAGISMLGVMQLEETLKQGGWTVSGSGPAEVAAGLVDGFEGRGRTNVTLAVTDTQNQVGDSEFAARVGAVIQNVTHDPDLQVSSSLGWATGPNVSENYIGKDRRTVLTNIGSNLPDTEASVVLEDVQERLNAELDGTGIQARLVSPDAFWGQINSDSLSGLAKAELIVFPAIILVLLLLYRSVAAVVVSLISTGIAILVSLGTVYLIGQFIDLSSFTLNAVTMLGLGVCVDYTLFLVRRYQQELEAGHIPPVALHKAKQTSGHTVIASGLTIAIAMAALFLVDLTIIRSLSLGVVVVVLFSLLVSITITPALLHLLGYHVNWGRLPGIRRGHHTLVSEISGNTRRVANHPVLSLVAGIVFLGILAAPAMQLVTFTPDARIVASDTSSRQGYDAIAKEFSIGSTAPVEILITSRDGDFTSVDFNKIAKLIDDLEYIDHVDRVRSPLDVLSQIPPNNSLDELTRTEIANILPADVTSQLGAFLSEDGKKMLIQVEVNDWAASDSARYVHDRVSHLVNDAAFDGLDIAVGGETAQGVSSNNEISDSLPVVLVTMLFVIFMLLLATFRSLVIPIIAIVVNLLSVGATYGLMVLVFQHGVLTNLLGFQALGYVQNFVPILLLALLFSLATDYQVFLLSRVREEYLRKYDNTMAIARGLTATAPLITGAALLMVIVFGAFAFTGVVPIQQLGFGLAIGIGLDATIVRMVIVPAMLRLTGQATWWFPGGRNQRSGPSSSD